MAWWTRHPQANIGLATGHRFDVLDVDGPAGAHAIQELAATHGLRSAGPLVRTGGGGWHFYLAPTGLGNVCPAGLAHVDWRGRGGYVVAPPSRHASGHPYQWVAGRALDTPLGQMPDVLLERLQPRHLQRPIDPVELAAADRSSECYAKAALTEELARVAAAPVGQRNRQLWESTRNLYNLATGTLDHHEVDQGLLTAAERCGLLAEEPRQTHRTLASGRQVGLAHPGRPRQPTNPERTHPSPTPPARAAGERTEGAFDRLNPTFGVPADRTDRLGRRDVAQREAALALGVRVAVHDSRQNEPNPVIWQAGQDYRMADALHAARTQPTRTRHGPERVGPER